MPGWLTRFRLRARATVSARHDRELRDELDLHLQLLEEEYTAQGMPPELARQRARRDFGNATRFQESESRPVLVPAPRGFRPGPALRGARDAAQRGVHVGRGAVAGRRHRRRHRDLCRRRRLHASRPAGSRPGTAGRVFDQRQPDLGTLAVRRVPAMAGFAGRAVRGRRQLGREAARRAAAREREARRSPRQPRVRQLLSGHGCRRRARQIACRRGRASRPGRRPSR